MDPKIVLALMHVLEVPNCPPIHFTWAVPVTHFSSVLTVMHVLVNCAPVSPHRTGTSKYSTTLPVVTHLLELILWVSVSIIAIYSLYWQFSCFP